MPTTVLQDSFTGANGTNITAHAMDVGSGWAANNGTWEIGSNAVSLTSSTANGIATANAGVADVTVSLLCGVPNSLNYIIGIVVRLTDASNCWFCVIERDGGGTPYLAIYEYNAAVLTSRASINIPAATNSVVTLTVVTSGNSISLTASTGETCNYGSATFNATATRFGIYGYSSGGYSAGAVDDFLVTTSTVATAYTMSGPTAGPVGAESAEFTITLNANPSGTIVITPAATGCTFTPSTLSFSGSTVVGTFTCNAAAAGTKTISATNNGGLTDPGNLSYVAKATTTRVYTVDGGPDTDTVGFRVDNLDGTHWADRIDTGITNHGGGTFSASVLVPADLAGVIIWDDGTGLLASESLDNQAAGGGIKQSSGFTGGIQRA